ncbi:RNA recognition RNP-1 [Apiospora arundinis]|uniref:RNA recognition RNP-1 n=1 Tax=Apiospora arundinis TaxID=335852 RepID=A0ABR2JIB8_9PEZI
MHNLMNLSRSRYGSSLPVTQAMPTISDVSSDNSEGGAPLHENKTFSQMRMGQVEHNRMKREVAATGGPKLPENHASDLHHTDSSADVGSFSATKQQSKANKGGKVHKLNPASNMFIPASGTVNDLTKIQTQSAENRGKLLQMLEQKKLSDNAAIDEQKPRHHQNSFTKGSNGLGHGELAKSATLSSEQDHGFVISPGFTRAQGQHDFGAKYRQPKQAHAHVPNRHSHRSFGTRKEANHLTDLDSPDRDTETSAHAPTQYGPAIPKSAKTGYLAANNGSQAVQAYDKGKGPAQTPSPQGYQPLPPIPDLSLDSAQCRDIVTFQPVDDDTRAGRSALLNSIVPADGLPSEAVLTHPDNLPFAVTADESYEAATSERGVVHIDNVPFGISRAEVIAFVGKNSRLLNDSEEPVHIIMDRVQGKTQDVYVEFATMKDAMAVVERHESNTASGRTSRLGDRPVRVTMSSPASLMGALFSYARGVVWHGYVPYIKEPSETEAYNTFTTFLSDEELSMVAKHAEEPRRSPFSKDARERPYECMISTVKKFPWYLMDRITLRHRYNIYNCCLKVLVTLQEAIGKEECPTRLNSQLLKRFIDAMMLCPGFTVLQKDNFAHVSRMSEMDMAKFNMPRFPNLWCHQYALGPRAGIPTDVIEYYIAIIREESSRDAMGGQDLGIKVALTNLQSKTSDYWGYFWREVGYKSSPKFENLTLQAAADMEWNAISRILHRALTRSQLRQNDQGALSSLHGHGPSSSVSAHNQLAVY